MRHIGGGVRVRRGAHARLVGKQAPRHAIAHRLFHADARCAAEHRLRVKGSLKNMAHHRARIIGILKQNHQRAQNINHRHKRHHKLREVGDAVDAADKNRACRRRQHQAHGDFRQPERDMNRARNGIRLRGVADKAQRDNQRDGKKARQKTRLAAPDFFGQTVGDVKRGAADVFAVANHAVFLRQQRFGKNRAHAQKSGNPHPKNRARPARHNRRCHARHVARADLRRNRHRQGLKLRQRLRVFFFLGKQAAEHRFKRRAKLGDLRRTQVNGEKQPDADKRVNQQITPQRGVNRADDV